MSTTNETTITNLNGYVTPEMYGAAGDGVTDDTLAVQSAVNAVTGTEKTLLLTNTYLLSSSLEIPNDRKSLRIKGGGLKFTGQSQHCFVLQGDTSMDIPESDIPSDLTVNDLFKFRAERWRNKAVSETGSEIKNSKVSIIMDGVYIYANSRGVFAFNVTGFMSNCDIYVPLYVFKHTAVLYCTNCKIRSIKEYGVLGVMADSMVSNCYISGYQQLTHEAVFCGGKIDTDVVFTNCFFNFFKYIVKNGQSGVYNGCVFNTCYSYYEYDHDRSDKKSRYIHAIFTGCVFENNTYNELKDNFNVTEDMCLGFIVVRYRRIYNLTVTDPVERDSDYNTVYIYPFAGVTMEINKLVLKNVNNKVVEFSPTQRNFDAVNIWPNTIYTDCTSLSYTDENNNSLMKAFNGAEFISPSGRISKCINVYNKPANEDPMTLVTIYEPVASN
ncbi:MAG: hypothetical protein J6A69_05785 [Clostridia bacterium]|nr:hypothetical protein [Clostridia bacterium]